jgi:hypothetical protein
LLLEGTFVLFLHENTKSAYKKAENVEEKTTYLVSWPILLSVQKCVTDWISNKGSKILHPKVQEQCSSSRRSCGRYRGLPVDEANGGGQTARLSLGGGRALEKHSSGMSLESGASSTTRSSGGEHTTRGLSRGAVFRKLGQQVELIRKTSSTLSLADLKSAHTNKALSS